MLTAPLGLLLVTAASIGQMHADKPAGPQPAPVTHGIDLSHLVDRADLAFEESEAYYGLLDHVRTASEDDLRSEAARLLRTRWEDSPRFRQWPIEEFPLFYDLTQQPESYRGRPVTMRGHLVRLVKYAAGDNEHGIDTLYEGWLVTPDAETHPTTVVCTEIPEGMRVGEELVDGVSVTGYFFKLHTYSSRDRKTRFAPMVLARTMAWTPPNPDSAGFPVTLPVTVAVSVGFILIAGVVVWTSARRTRALRDARFQDTVPKEAPDFLNDLTS